MEVSQVERLQENVVLRELFPCGVIAVIPHINKRNRSAVWVTYSLGFHADYLFFSSPIWIRHMITRVDLATQLSRGQHNN
jgi:hypothetical protein